MQGSKTCPRWETAGIFFSPQNHLKKSFNSCFFFLVSLASSHLLSSKFRALSFFFVLCQNVVLNLGIFISSATKDFVGRISFVVVVVVQLFSRVWLFVTPRTAAHQASLSFTISWSLHRLMSIALTMPSNYLTCCHPLLTAIKILCHEHIVRLASGSLSGKEKVYTSIVLCSNILSADLSINC